MNILFVGGTGIISSACVRVALAQGMDVTLLNRGLNTLRPSAPGVRVLHADIRDRKAVQDALAGASFDAVVDFTARTPDHIDDALAAFSGRTGQYVFISSASTYRKPIASLPITESTPLENPYWQYARNKIACEERLKRAHQETQFPFTIVRPPHTYDQTSIPISGGWTVLDRMRRRLPVIIHGDGTSLWVLTHHEDFARALVGVLGNPMALGETYHITTDELLTWHQIYHLFARHLSVEPILVPIASRTIQAADSTWGDSLLGDKAHSVMFDNRKIKRLVPGWSADIPFHRGSAEIVAWHLADPSRQKVNPDFNGLCDRLLQANPSSGNLS